MQRHELLERIRALKHLGAFDFAAASVMITANLGFSAWAAVFGGATMTAVLLDRLAHRCARHWDRSNGVSVARHRHPS